MAQCHQWSWSIHLVFTSGKGISVLIPGGNIIRAKGSKWPGRPPGRTLAGGRAVRWRHLAWAESTRPWWFIRPERTGSGSGSRTWTGTPIHSSLEGVSLCSQALTLTFFPQSDHSIIGCKQSYSEGNHFDLELSAGLYKEQKATPWGTGTGTE